MCPPGVGGLANPTAPSAPGPAGRRWGATAASHRELQKCPSEALVGSGNSAAIGVAVQSQAGPGQGREAGDLAAAPGTGAGGDPRTTGRLWKHWCRADAAVRLTVSSLLSRLKLGVVGGAVDCFGNMSPLRLNLSFSTPQSTELGG